MADFNFPPGTKREDADLKEVVLKQFNYMRIKGINLVQDADDLVNLYLKICKAFEEK